MGANFTKPETKGQIVQPETQQKKVECYGVKNSDKTAIYVPTTVSVVSGSSRKEGYMTTAQLTHPSQSRGDLKELAATQMETPIKDIEKASLSTRFYAGREDMVNKPKWARQQDSPVAPKGIVIRPVWAGWETSSTWEPVTTSNSRYFGGLSAHCIRESGFAPNTQFAGL